MWMWEEAGKVAGRIGHNVSVRAMRQSVSVAGGVVIQCSRVPCQLELFGGQLPIALHMFV